ncbi:hypothetical protein ABZU86_10130 [Streptomyces sp. NPDC005271]|uniref:hypothetical protein n=1 Tax=unclassified Streptomyces TaxID=2593676 RepID=UPI0033A11625
MTSDREADRALAGGQAVRDSGNYSDTVGITTVNTTATSVQSALGQALREASDITVCGVASRELVTAIQGIASSQRSAGSPLPWDSFRYVTPAPTLILANRGHVRLGPVVQRWQSAVTALRNSVQQWQTPHPSDADGAAHQPAFHLLSTDTLHLQMTMLVKRRDTGRHQLWVTVGPSLSAATDVHLIVEQSSQAFEPVAHFVEDIAEKATNFITRQVACEPAPDDAAEVGNQMLAAGTEPADAALWQLSIRTLEPYGAAASPRRTCLPVAICVVRSMAAGRRLVLLKRRSHMNSNDDFGRLSLLSARVLEEDVAVALGVVPFIDRDSSGAIDALWMAAHRPPRLTVSRGAFVHAAQRELFYSTGLDIPEDRLRLHGFQILDREDSREQLFFCVFEVVLYRSPDDELDLASQWNSGDPEVLPQVTESALYSGAYDGQLNRLLVRGQDWLKATVFSRTVGVEPDAQ